MKSKVYAIAINQCQNWDDPDAIYEAARIIKKDTGEIVIGAYYCKNAYQIFGYHFCVQQMNENLIGIVFDDVYLGLTNTNPREFEAMLMHEVGHLVNGDFDKERDNNAIRQERESMIQQGKVMPVELAADRFAVEHCGKNAMIRMLDIVISTRKIRDPFDIFAIKELELRKQAVKRM